MATCSGFEYTLRNGISLTILSEAVSMSLDTPVGGPYNIASYSLLLAMLAQITDLESGDFIWTINDAHIYVDQLELVDEQLAREPQPLPTLWLNPDIKEIDDFKFEDIEIREYQPLKSQIKYPVAV